MIYTVTFNPSLDYTVTVDDFLLGKTNRTASEQMTPGGKGINVSAVLRNLGVEKNNLWGELFYLTRTLKQHFLILYPN